jgi:hypothetical protein
MQLALVDEKRDGKQIMVTGRKYAAALYTDPWLKKREQSFFVKFCAFFDMS